MDDPVFVSGSLILACLCLTGAGLDISARRLPNWLAAITWITGLGFAALAGGTAAMLSPLSHSALALLGTMVLFRYGLIGGGDAKFYAGIAGWFALNHGSILLISVALCGVALVVAWLLLCRLHRLDSAAVRRSMSSLPYGVAIAFGAMVCWAITHSAPTA